MIVNLVINDGSNQMARLGWPGIWHRSRLYDDGGLPVHLYPMPVNIRGQGPLNDGDPEIFRMVCWCSFDGCVGSEDQFGFPTGNHRGHG